MGTSLLQQAASTLVSINIPSPDADVERIIRDALNFAVRREGALLMVNVPTHEDRQILSVRQRMLAESMEFDRRKVGLLIAQMLNCYAMPIKENETAEEVISLFVRELSIEPKVPTWAVAQAVSAIRLGQAVGVSLVHRPSTIAVRRIADGFAWKAKAEITIIADILKGRRALPEIAPEERKRVGDKFRALAESMKKRNAARVALDAEEDAAKLKAMIGDAAFQAIPNAKVPRRPMLGQMAAKLAKRA